MGTFGGIFSPRRMIMLAALIIYFHSFDGALRGE